MGWRVAAVGMVGLGVLVVAGETQSQERMGPREMGLTVGELTPGPLNAITDVPGVLVGQVTLARGDSVNTGVTAVLPHAGNSFREKVPAAIVVGNGFGKLIGFTQVQELGELESPIVLTCTLCAPRAADAVITYLLSLPGNEQVRSVNPVVGETNDGFLNDIRSRPITSEDVLQAIRVARGGAVEQGSVGAGRGTRTMGWKGGIGTSSRRLSERRGGWTVGVLVQSNFSDGSLTVRGAPVGQELERAYLKEKDPAEREGGSIMIVVATDAPLEHRNLERLARRALAGLARTGSAMSNGSGDYVIAFSTTRVAQLGAASSVRNEEMSPLFQAVIEATEEAIYNSLFLATSVRGHRGNTDALPLDATRAILQRHGVLRP